jgi:threonine synthase
MLTADFPDEIRPHLLPRPSGELIYRCLQCEEIFGIESLLYTCPKCKSILLIEDLQWDRLKEYGGSFWRRLFDYRRMLNIPALKGIFLFQELIAPLIPLEDIIYLGEGHTPIVQANDALREWVGLDFYFKNDGQNPSASFKDRGMACALSYLNYLIRRQGLTEVLSICASTGDTSAAAALYSAYMSDNVKSAVLLPHKKVTPQQISQPLGSGARVFEIPGVFDDCMKVVEHLAEHYNVALLNSKNTWRIQGQESYSFEVAQSFDYELAEKVVVVPIGNAGNITAIMGGFLKLLDLGVIETLPKIIGVQSEHADPV